MISGIVVHNKVQIGFFLIVDGICLDQGNVVLAEKGKKVRFVKNTIKSMKTLTLTRSERLSRPA